MTFYVLSESTSSILKYLILMQASFLCLKTTMLEENLLVKMTLIRDICVAKMNVTEDAECFFSLLAFVLFV